MRLGQSHLSSRHSVKKRGLIVKNEEAAALNFAAVGAKTMLAFHIQLDKRRLIGRGNRLPAFVADLLRVLLNILAFFGIAHFFAFCLTLRPAAAVLGGEKFSVPLLSRICANCADRKNFLETVRFSFAENKSSPDEPWRGLPIGNLKGTMRDSRTGVLGKGRRLCNGKTENGIPNPDLLVLSFRVQKPQNPNASPLSAARDSD